MATTSQLGLYYHALGFFFGIISNFTCTPGSWTLLCHCVQVKEYPNVIKVNGSGKPCSFILQRTRWRELTEYPTFEKQKKIEKTHAKKDNHTYKTIFMWFGNLPTSTELQGFHYYQGRIQRTTCSYNIFSLSKTQHQHSKTLITKVGFTMS